ncbi:SAM-dependent methyltransferase [Rugosimonospora acidiphila]|uniref:SAM-dependent methyltransferase n=1 Tax=Rugosimonospora acidiphila TaxID=556531 RepID=A0ABP9RYR5_9ACTN
MDETPTGTQPATSRIDTSVAHPARRYDYFLGGKDNFAADRESADRMMTALPTARVSALENRRFLRRAVEHLAGEAGIRQFLDIGSGIPTSPNTHEIAQGIAPDARVVYVDNDPIVLAHARALLTSGPEGATAYVDADLREPRRILEHPDVRGTLDLSQPVALMLVAVLHFIPDTDDPRGLIAPLIQALAPGSYLVLSHATLDFMPARAAEHIRSLTSAEGFYPRPRAGIETLLSGLDPVDPGLVPTPEWRLQREPAPRPSAADVAGYAAVARVA